MPFPIDRDEILNTEAALGVRFPASHVGAMQRSNGGTVEVAGDVWYLVPFRNLASAKLISRTASDIVHETRQNRGRPGFSTRAVAIALNGTGECLCFVPREDDPARLSDAVYLWNPDSGLHLVADDYADLLFEL